MATGAAHPFLEPAAAETVQRWLGSLHPGPSSSVVSVQGADGAVETEEHVDFKHAPSN